VRLVPARDDKAAIAEALRHETCDLIVTIGGASVGDYDLVKPALADLGLELKVESLKMRPGKPTWFGMLADGRRVLGLPGNPASAFVCAWLFLKPLLERLSGRYSGLRLLPGIAAADLPANGTREMFLRAQVEVASDGRLLATAERHQDSHLQWPLARANALIRRAPNAGPLSAGEVVEFLLIGDLEGRL
jgi:molybdopterin molybdotransferase